VAPERHRPCPRGPRAGAASGAGLTGGLASAGAPVRRRSRGRGARPPPAVAAAVVVAVVAVVAVAVVPVVAVVAVVAAAAQTIRRRRGKSRWALRVVSARQVSPSGCAAASREATCAPAPASGVQQ
jgi:hypothetical protein